MHTFLCWKHILHLLHVYTYLYRVYVCVIQWRRRQFEVTGKDNGNNMKFKSKTTSGCGASPSLITPLNIHWTKKIMWKTIIYIIFYNVRIYLLQFAWPIFGGAVHRNVNYLFIFSLYFFLANKLLFRESAPTVIASYNIV